jgi:hypothetical protein
MKGNIGPAMKSDDLNEAGYPGYEYYGVHLPAGVPKGGYCLWQYTAGRWVLKKAACERGYDRGSPPSEKGDFEGHLRKTPCRRIQRRT